MSAKNVIEKLQIIAREKETQRSDTKARGGTKTVENNRNRRGVEKSIERRHVEYSIGGCKVTTAFIIIFGMCKKEGI